MKKHPATTDISSPDSDLEAASAAFLEAEQNGGGEESEASESALFALFAALPQVEPNPDFVAAVLRGAGLELEARDLGWAARALTAAAYLLVLTGAFWILPFAAELLVRFDLAATLAALVDAFAFLAARLGDLIALAQRLAGFGRILRLILTSPPVLTVSMMCAALTLLMGRWLVSLLAVPRSSLHAAR